MESQSFDLVVIGGGPGGYVAAIKAAQLGLKTACVEMRKTLGGTCLNVGCIPSKALLNASEKYHAASHDLSKFGIICKDVTLDLKTMMGKKDAIVGNLTQGIELLFKKNKVSYISGKASIPQPGIVKVTKNDGSHETVQAKNILIATGSVSSSLPGIEFDEKVILSSTGALELTSVPKSLIVIGGGYIGLEMGSVWNRLGSAVTIVEYAENLVPMVDTEVGQALEKSLKNQGMKFLLNTQVTGIEKSHKGATLKLSNAKTQETLPSLSAEVVLICVGRRPFTEGLGLSELGMKLNERGFIDVNSHYQTSVSGIYAIGDVIPGPMLAHKAEEEGVAVAEILAGQAGHVNYDAIPSVIYTMPEVASVGKTEQDLKKEGVSYRIGKFPFLANSRAKATDSTEGFVKILTHAETDRILGAHLISADAGSLIGELVLAMEFKASGEDIARTCHAHPTTSEAIKEAALGAYFKSIHI
jgi:dihydrolipoamide dehydrogenase